MIAGALLAPVTAQTGFLHGLPTDSHYFPIAVWLQDPAQAPRYQGAGINLYIGLWQGPTDAQLAALKAARMPVFCEQNAVGLAHRNDPTIVGWMHGDEPDNAQPLSGGGYGPCVPPPKVVAEYRQMRANDPTRPVMLNLGQGVANDEWIGRGNGSSLKDYETYVKGADIVSFDVYPVAGLPKPNSENYLWYVPKGVERLNRWVRDGGTPGERVWNCIECTRIDGGRMATPRQVESEVWMALVHGSQGLIYFVHQFKPTFDEHALLDEPEMLRAVTALNARVRTLAPILNSPTVAGAATVASSNAEAPVDLMVKRFGGELYVFAVNMRNVSTHASISLSGPSGRSNILVDDENRTLTATNGHFEETFGPYQFHLYRLRR